jgi:hypothetical protein
MWLLLLACAEPEDTALACEPTVTWQGWGDGFFRGYCNSCHNEGRLGAPEGVSFQTLDDVLAHTDRIRARTLVSQDMPPAGGVSPEDLERLDALLQCPGEAANPPVNEPDTPVWSAEDFTLALEDAARQPVPDPYAFRELYLGLLQAGDANCPGTDDDLGQPEVTLQGCTSTSGIHYAGISSWEDQQMDAEVQSFQLLNGDFTITSTETLSVGGRIGLFAFNQPNGDVMASLRVSGTFVLDGADDPWLAAGGGTVLEADLNRVNGATTVELDASLSLGRPFHATGLALGGSCGAEGAVQVRGPDALWYWADLECGCGMATVSGAELGTVCPNLDPLRVSLRETLSP